MAAKKSGGKRGGGGRKSGGSKRGGSTSGGRKSGSRKTSGEKKSSGNRSGGKKSGGKKSGGKKGGAKREMMAPKGNKRLIRRDSKGQIRESDDLGRSLGQDVKNKARTKVKPGQGDRGDQQR